MDDNAAEYEYTFTMPDGEAFTILVEQQENGRWYYQSSDTKGNVIEEAHDYITKEGTVSDAVHNIIVLEK